MRAVDVAVIGGGIVGLSVAHELAARGVARVAVLERDRCGEGSTSRATGGIRAQFGAEVNVRLTLRSLEAFRDWGRRYGGDAGYRPVGYVFLATTAEQLDGLRAGAERQRGLGARVELLEAPAVAELLPGVVLDGVAGATFGPDDGLGDPGTAVNSLLAACRRRGVEVREGAAVTAIEMAGGRATGVVAGGEPVAADIVVVAAGPWSAPVARLAGVALPVEPHHRQAYRAGALPGLAYTTPLTVDLGTGVYFHADGDGLVFGGGDRESPPGFDDRVWPDGAPRVVELLTRRLPAVADAPLTGMWAGLREMTPDDVAVLGPIDEVPGLFAAAGFSGHGFMHAPAAGEIAAALIAGAAPPFDVSAMAPGRFAHGVAREGYAF
ncbi:MAG TPA: FAD-binding oxidoreductase [Candidatus Dormibacteraeota bacterium]|nr:FAD-binding oxidoreductase [Candidatus Dormibacteraeota bacterium]